jgi:hypothetical protein
MNIYYGVTSKNQIDLLISYSLKHPKQEITFIPSRRQVEYNGGYVNNWTTSEFSTYVKSRNKNIKIERDHGGPGQGLNDDDGYMSLEEDCKYFDLIHIDPWKKYPNLIDAIIWTINMINFCYARNPKLEYEIGTEEAIRSYTVEELNTFISAVQRHLPDNIFSRIKYCVIQCGNSLLNGSNNGHFDEQKLIEMLSLVKRYNLIAKEHNGDWISMDVIGKKESLGLKCINIAPEFGMIESKCILSAFKANPEHYEKMYSLCFNSGKWKKWVSSDFDFTMMKDQLILITGHYVFSNEEFIEIKKFYPDIDAEINECLLYKIYELNNIFTIRSKCIFCDSTDLTELLENDFKSTLSLGLSDKPDMSQCFMPYNIQVCTKCNSAQIKYTGNLDIIYKTNHADDYGQVKSEKHTQFRDFIIENSDITGIIEVGSCNGALAKNIKQKRNVEYTIIEPSFTGDRTNLTILPEYLENVDLNQIPKSNSIVMSDVFEHFYNPKEILNKLSHSLSVKYIYLNHPDFDYAIKNNIYYILNSEHTFLIEHQFLIALFEKCGFTLNRRFNFNNFSLFLEFKRSDVIIDRPLINVNTRIDVQHFFNTLKSYVKKCNTYMETHTQNTYYIWPTAVYSITLLTLGLNYNKLTGILDNSPNKIGKYLHGYNLFCTSFNELLKTNENNVCIFIACAGNYIKELDLSHTKVKIIDVTTL